MNVSFQQDEDILKVFQHGNYIGYVDAERMLHMFDTSGHSVPWRNVEDRQQVGTAVKEWDKRSKPTPDEELMRFTLNTLSDIRPYSLDACTNTNYLLAIEKLKKRLGIS